MDIDREQVKKDKRYYIDEVTDLFVMAYVFGTQEASNQLNTAIAPDMQEMQDAINEKIAGKDYIERLNEYLENGTFADIKRVLDTDTHRIFNNALLNSAKKGGATTKTWNCMMLPTSRDTHVYLNGVTIPIDAEFYSFNGGRTQYPGQWGIAEEDCNCLCWLTFDKS